MPMTVKAILSTKGGIVHTIEPTATLADAVKDLAERRVGALVVTGAGDRVIGIVSERDIVYTLAARGEFALTMPVAEVMTRNVITCREGSTVSAIMEQMTDGKFRHLPVVEQEELVGIISIGDIVKHRLQEMERDAAALREYILSA
jgi:CBS domain-containing protein